MAKQSVVMSPGKVVDNEKPKGTYVRETFYYPAEVLQVLQPKTPNGSTVRVLPGVPHLFKEGVLIQEIERLLNLKLTDVDHLVLPVHQNCLGIVKTIGPVVSPNRITWVVCQCASYAEEEINSYSNGSHPHIMRAKKHDPAEQLGTIVYHLRRLDHVDQHKEVVSSHAGNLHL